MLNVNEKFGIMIADVIVKKEGEYRNVGPVCGAVG